MSVLRLQPLVRLTLSRLGERGEAWRVALPRTLAGLEHRLGVTVERGLPGGSTAHLVVARGARGACVLKIPLPDVDLTAEAALLEAADGRGYVRLLGRDAPTGSLVLEEAGEALERTPGDPTDRLRLLVDVLPLAWRPAPTPEPHGPVGSRATERAGRVRELDQRLGGVLPAPVRDAALAAAARLEHPPAVVWAHGDPHPSNLLRALDGRGWVFVDPDGVVAEPASDAGVLLRGGSEALLAAGADAAALQAARVARVAARLDLDPARVADWALLERVATGLHVLDLGAARLAGPMLDSAALLVGAAPPAPFGDAGPAGVEPQG
ncbi:aminoglycoside phosphotransferase family protein [Nocardioides sp. TRM66260-LWL]|uniref:aminoglycoside phosphotransferase family protein n=1 Tax=Nocardioides sp. TRM66260-LWL TaxID=2874478 RepID=UPI001CC661E2|nr:aminoglycoside phosphotransferase family protein [Nocardioides sp. TRM66260-LWL]MBZ5734581.1 aminoglycoside phosphotransferase family protein [Nocardioides sp. TRM66260-LWL]